MNSYIQSLAQAEDWNGLVGLLEYCRDSVTEYGVTHLAKYLSDYNLPCWWHIGRACRAQGQPGFVLDAMNQALELVGQSGNEFSLIERLLDFGKFRYRFYDQDYEPVRLWEEALSRLSTASKALRREWADEEAVCVRRTAQLCFDIAVQNHKGKCKTISLCGADFAKAEGSQRGDK